MLWVALHLPHLPLEALSRGHASPEPWALTDDRTVLACDAGARALGVRSGMGIAAARALAPRLRLRPRQESLEREALEGVAGWLCRFTPSVSLEPPCGVVAEVEASLRLFGGLEPLVGRIRAGIREMGFSVALAAAPTVRAACWLAAAGRDRLIDEIAAIEPVLARLPARLACSDPKAIELLRDIGIGTIGELLALPRTGVARRFGKALLDDLERALAKLPEPRAFFVPPARFAARLDLPAEVVHAEGVLFAARRLLVQLEGVLAARQACVRRFTLTLGHRNARSIAVEIELASPGRETERFLPLLRERLDTLSLSQPVESIRLEAGDFVPFDGGGAGLFRDGRREGEIWARLVERLRSRLGSDAVHALGLHPDHRPERAWRALGPEERVGQEAVGGGPRPLWLIEPPRRLEETDGVPHRDGALELLAGPERIESGWWDEGDAVRDYFIARAPSSGLLWIFRERHGGGWYLHGIFS